MSVASPVPTCRVVVPRSLRARLTTAALAAACALLGSCTALTMSYADETLDALFNAERAFSRDAAVSGFSAAFTHFIEPEAIVFRPGPVRFGEYQAAHPPKPGDGGIVVQWAPQAGAVAHVGDLGFTTGPFRVTRRTDPANTPPVEVGYFFSVWAQTPRGWRVVLDAGVTTDVAPPQEGFANFRAPIVDVRVPRTLNAQTRAASRDALLALERAPHSLTLSPPDVSGSLPSFYSLTTSTTRWLRPGPAATFGVGIQAALQPAGGRLDWVPADVVVSASEDFAYSWGRYTRTSGVGGVEQGWYVHVWQRNDLREWRLAAIVWMPER
ncbi:MAG: hypothetical protein JSR18_14025 [Proteobacteria bacterium]|nr:hypothetical protein [Pseudomonadota bacterium]